MSNQDQRLIQQIADLSRNMSSLVDSIRENTSVTQEILENNDNPNFDKISGSLESLKGIAKLNDSINDLNLKDLGKNIERILGPKGPLISKIEDMGEVIKNMNIPGPVEGERGIGEEGTEMLNLQRDNTRSLNSLISYMTSKVVNPTFKNQSILANATEEIGEPKAESVQSILKKLETEGISYVPSEQTVETSPVDKELLSLKSLFLRNNQERNQSSDLIEKMVKSLYSNNNEELPMLSSREDELKRIKAPEGLAGTGIGLDFKNAESVVNPIIRELRNPEKRGGELEGSKISEFISKLGTERKKEESEENKNPPTEVKTPEFLSKISKESHKLLGGITTKTGLGGIESLMGIIARNKTGETATGFQNAASKISNYVPELIPKLTSLGKSPENSAPGISNMVSNINKLSVPSPPKPAPQKETNEKKQEVKEEIPSKMEEMTETESSVSRNSEESMGYSRNETTSSSVEPKQSISTQDIQDIKDSLSRIASILEGTLTVSPIDGPFRPDSRRV